MLYAFDLGTDTGVAWGEPGAMPESETWRFPGGAGASLGRFLALFAERFDRACLKASLIVFEAPFLGPKLLGNMHTARRLLGMPAVCELLAFKRRVEIAECQIVTVRKAFCGNGGAKKDDVMRMCVSRGFHPQTDHEGDALACWWFTVACRWPGKIGGYDPLFQALGRGR